MANRHDILNVDQIQQDSSTAKTALSAHERAIFEQYLQQKRPERAQTDVANDADRTSLSYLFGIFH